MDIDMSQTEADALIAMHKHRIDEDRHDYPYAGCSLRIPLVSGDRREDFMLDIARGRIELTKSTFQNRSRHVIVLVRLDIGGSHHRNPDDAEVPCPHIHLYKEGFGDKWAFPLPTDRFTNPGNQLQTLQEFMQYCNIVNPPNIIGRLFI
ncbi:MAG: hypothetical protein HQK96_21130 [Nitrospirae bacterium]|nr:hypothetical protein [Nitrospirota bacterium]